LKGFALGRLLHGDDTLSSSSGVSLRCAEFEIIKVGVKNGRSDPGANFDRVDLGLAAFAPSLKN
jgi:hypothetical protein